MSIAVKLVTESMVISKGVRRSFFKQIEYWVNADEIVEENQDHTYSFIKDILVEVGNMFREQNDRKNLLIW